MTETKRHYRIITEMTQEEIDVRNMKYLPQGVKVIRLRSGRFAMIDGWNRAIPRLALGLESTDVAGTPYDDCGDFGLSEAELLPSIIFALDNWDFSMPRTWGKSQTPAAVGKSTGTSASPEDLGF